MNSYRPSFSHGFVFCSLGCTAVFSYSWIPNQWLLLVRPTTGAAYPISECKPTTSFSLAITPHANHSSRSLVSILQVNGQSPLPIRAKHPFHTTSTHAGHACTGGDAIKKTPGRYKTMQHCLVIETTFAEVLRCKIRKDEQQRQRDTEGTSCQSRSW